MSKAVRNATETVFEVGSSSLVALRLVSTQRTFDTLTHAEERRCSRAQRSRGNSHANIHRGGCRRVKATRQAQQCVKSVQKALMKPP
eukprot:4767643-Pleurochrysis_carterae.AAC.3